MAIEEPRRPSEPVAKSARKRPAMMPWVLSAKSVSALAEQAARMRRFVEQHTELDARDVAYSLATTGALFDYRAVTIGAERDALMSGLAAIASGTPAPNVLTARATATGKTLFVFPGQGSQWLDMAIELLDSSPAFSDQMRQCDAAFAEFVDWSLLEAVRGGPGSPALDRVDVEQPVGFGVVVSMAAQWRALGVQPDAVLGHSHGEIAAAYVAGALSLRDAAKVVTLRSKAISAIAGAGGMVSLTWPAEQVLALIEPWGRSISVAAQTGRSSTVVTGSTEAICELVAECERTAVPAVRIPVDYAAHSTQVEALREPLRESLAGLLPGIGDIVFISAVTGAGLDPSILDGDYWFANLRQPVLFQQAVQWAYEHGYRTFIEPSPQPVLAVAIQESLEDHGDDHRVIGTRRREGGVQRFLLSAAEAHVHGKSADWASMFADTGARRIDLPTYVFDQKRDSMAPLPGFGDASSLGVTGMDHPLLGAIVAQADSEEFFLVGRLSLMSHPWLADHKVHGVVLVPGAAMVELALHAGHSGGCSHVDQLVLSAPLIVGEHSGVAVQVVVGAWRQSGDRPVRIYSRIDREGTDRTWTCHGEGVLSPTPDDTFREEFDHWPPEGAELVDVSEAYLMLAAHGFEYGPGFRALRGVWRRRAEVFVEAELPEQAKADASRFGLHPVLLDAILHGVGVAGILAESELTRLPFEWEGFSLNAIGATWLRARITLVGDDTVAISLFDVSGTSVGRIDSLAFRGVSPTRLLTTSAAKVAALECEAAT
jgi:acyl transferase domain-containing protein